MKNIIVTPTFAPDFERCKSMIYSAEKWVHGADEHLLIVDPADIKLFKPLAGGRVHLCSKTDFLPVKALQIPFQKRWWLTECSLPVRGWIFQQIIKLAAAHYCRADSVTFADSDLMFIRDFDLNDLWKDNRLRLFRTNRGPKLYSQKRYKNWYQFGCQALDLGNPNNQSGAYISQLTTMRPDTVRQLCLYLENKYQRPWYQTLMNTWDFSEYTLYGLFADKIGSDQSGHYMSDTPLCHSSWHYQVETEEQLRKFVVGAQPHHKAVHLQSNLKLDPCALSKILA